MNNSLKKPGLKIVDSSTVTAEPSSQGPLPRGLLHPKVVDEIRTSKENGLAILLMYQSSPWFDTDAQTTLKSVEEKLNNYVDYCLDGYFKRDYPQYATMKLSIELWYFEDLPAPMEKLLGAFSEFLIEQPISFKLRKTNQDEIISRMEALQLVEAAN